MNTTKALHRELLRQIRKAGSAGLAYGTVVVESDHYWQTVSQVINRLERFKLIQITREGQMTATATP
jgi:hypothetical protein